MTGTRRGRLRSAGDAPRYGETTESLATVSGVTVEQILSGELSAPQDYDQDHDEWVVVLAGGPVLEIGKEAVTLTAGEWLVLPKGVPHRLVSTRRQTSWLAVRVPPDSSWSSS